MAVGCDAARCLGRLLLLHLERSPMDWKGQLQFLTKVGKVKLKFHGSSFPRSILVTREDVANKSRGSRVCRGRGVLRGSSRRCHEDATRKMVPLHLSLTGYSSSQLVSPLRELMHASRMGSHSVNCHPAEETFPPLPRPFKADTRFGDPGGMHS